MFTEREVRVMIFAASGYNMAKQIKKPKCSDLDKTETKIYAVVCGIFVLIMAAFTLSLYL